MLLARCCWPVATVDSLIAVGPVSPLVAKSTAEVESVALELGSMIVLEVVHEDDLELEESVLQ